MNRKKRRLIVIAALGALVIITTFVVILLATRSDGATSTSTQAVANPVAASARPSLDEESAVKLEQALNSKDKAQQASVLVPDLRSGDWQASVVLPEGSVLKVDRGSFDAEGNVGKVLATVKSAAGQEDFTLYLLRANSQWLIYQTEKVG